MDGSLACGVLQEPSIQKINAASQRSGERPSAEPTVVRAQDPRHGEQTLEAKAVRSAKDAEMQALEDIMHVMNMTSAKRTRGRKALGYVPIKTFEEARQWIYLDLLKKHEAETSAET